MTRCCQVVFQVVMQWESRTHAHKKVESPRDVDMAAGVQTISQRAMRTVRYLGDLASDLDAPMATVVAQKCRLFSLSVQITPSSASALISWDYIPSNSPYT